MSTPPEDAPKRRKRRRPVLLSPLRYPGGKRRLAPYVAEALRLNGLRPKLYVEPFAGGASVAIQLLHENLVDEVVLGEKDPMVASFWRTVFAAPERLIAELRTIEPSLELWEHYRRARPRTALGWAVKCLYLNRTSFSGILSPTAGPIGGRSQSSAHAIGCRFPIERLAQRITDIAAHAHRVRFIHAGDWRALMVRVRELRLDPEDVLYYLDPPFYEKADRLYRYSFRERDHRELHDTLGQLGGSYILSYDAAEPIVRRYRAHASGTRHIELLYSATRRGELVQARELIVSNLPRMPEHTRLWRSVGDEPETTDEPVLAPLHLDDNLLVASEVLAVS